MKERGMIFNAPMVRAILDGRKTQTRRLYNWKRQPAMEMAERDDGTLWPWAEDCENGGDIWFQCPFGQPGDRIWVRETWAMLGNEDRCPIDWNDNIVKDGGHDAARIYRASCTQGDYGLWQIPDDADWKPHTDSMQYDGTWRPSIHMPRWASRITLEIADVRVERLNSISEADARSEGITPAAGGVEKGWEHRFNFRELWMSIYGEESWQANPWVWVIEFRRVEGG
ncbi:hypothetical protein LMA04_17820 [Pseudescherichia vulneris]|uniref:hypothetical protein n=1 Tax=Pseudescherichia vulneris TaxID=566 RepID=UPI00227C4C0C|nr:hypothetical protein [Pseudescherichia vulneris]WAH51932.1 hypothetical protein LMA04_17820 [Pseudescherichia vulneris]